MAVLKKKSVVSKSAVPEGLKEAYEKLGDLLKKRESIVEDILKTKRTIFDIESAPYKEGDHVMFEVAQGRARKECECVLSVELNGLEMYNFKATPIKEDGSLSGRSFKVCDVKDLKYAGGK